MIKGRSGGGCRGIFLPVASFAGLLRVAVMAIGLGGLAGCAPKGGETISPAGELASTPEAGISTPPSGSSPASSKGAQTVSPAAALVSTPGAGTPPSGSSAPTAAIGGDYRIKPDDILQIVVYQAPDFNRDAQVDATGNIALPLLGGIPVAGRTAREVEAEITGRLKAKYMQNPQVSVSIKDAVGLRVTVEGAVAKPGVVQVRGGVTLLSLIAESGGFTDTAEKSGVLIVRNTDKGRTVARYDANAIAAGTAEDPPVFGGDTVVVDDSAAKTAFKNLGSALGVVGIAALFLH
jgi:polysaccharide export outer membrane protein